jgi:hypothetical protein
MGSMTLGFLVHHLERQRSRAAGRTDVHFAMGENVQWPDEAATIHAINNDRGIQEIHFTRPEIDEFIRRFGPTPKPPEEAALETLSSMSDQTLIAFLERLFSARAKSRD